MRDLLFPFKRVKKGSKVVLYGAGKTGTIFWRQNEIVGWCNICLVVDSNYLEKKDFPTPVFNPADIYKLRQLDYIIVAVLSESARIKIRHQLIEGGIPENKIIEGADYYYKRENFENVICYQNETEVEKSSQTIKIAFEMMSGGIGDYVIFIKFYQEIVNLVPQSKIDILNSYTFVTKSMIESILYGQENLGNVKQSLYTKEEYKKYDVVIHLGYEPILRWMNYAKIQRISPQLLKKLQMLYVYQKKNCVESTAENLRIILDRAKVCHWNRYTMMNLGNIFEISNEYSELYIDGKYKKDFEDLKLDKPYITYNYGANNVVGKVQTKTWPYDYHLQLNNMLKKRFPDIEIVQIGGSYVERVPGADRYILGANLDVVKQILENSVCHFDSEDGLVHLATQLGTKCFVVFGPTPVWFYGYDKNENIGPKCCGECMGLIKDWQTRCYLYDKPKCMYSILPEYIFSILEEYLTQHYADFIKVVK